MRLYVILGSHACAAARLMLAHKGVAYHEVRLPTAAQPMALPLLGFPGGRVAV